MKLNDTKINIGGLMRCCLATMFDGMADDTEVQIGQEVRCKHCTEGSVGVAVLGEDKVWRWKGVQHAESRTDSGVASTPE